MLRRFKRHLAIRVLNHTLLLFLQNLVSLACWSTNVGGLHQSDLCCLFQLDVVQEIVHSMVSIE